MTVRNKNALIEPKISREAWNQGVANSVLEDISQRGPTTRTLYKLKNSPHISNK